MVVWKPTAETKVFRLEKRFEKIKKSCWQTKAVMIRYQSCRWEQQQRRITDLWQINSNATLKIPRFSEKWIARFKNKQIDEKDREATRINSKQCQIKLAGKKLFNMRVWSWLRMNAGGVPNTCKSNGIYMKPSDCKFSGGRVSNAWVTCLVLGDNSWKRLLIPHKRTASHEAVWKTPVVQDGPASD